MKKRIYAKEMDDIDRKLLPGLHHVEWRDKGESKDKTKYGGSGKIKQNEKKKLHKVTV